MKRIFLTLLIILAFLGVSSAQEQTKALPGAPDTKVHNFWHTFTGQWAPNIDASLIGADNYKTLQNLRYNDGGLEGVQGYSKINSAAVVNATNLKIRNGHQLKKDEPAETHVLVQAYNAGLTTSKVYENPTAIPDVGSFTATELHTDASGAGIGRFSNGAQGTVFYCNGVESMVYGGNESRVAAFITSTDAITDTITNPKDFTEKVQNKMQTADEVANISGGNDSYTQLLLHMDGTDASTDFIDSSSNDIADTPVNDAQMDTAQKKFGTASGLFGGDDDYVTFTDDNGVSDYWFMDTDPFTVDSWVRFNELPTAGNSMYFFSQYDDATNFLCGYIFNTGGVYYLSFRSLDGGVGMTLNAIWDTPIINKWYHIAFIRGWGGNANDFSICVDGTSIGTETDTDPFAALAADLQVGAYNGGYLFNGWLDEFRVSKGIARWTANFTPPARAYQADSLYWVVGSTRPLEGLKYYISNANTTASTLTGQEWNGVSWIGLTIGDNTDTGGTSLATTGTVTWDSTASTSKPKYLNGLYLYWYQFYLDVGQANIYYCTVDTGFQDVVDIWDGVFRQPIQFQVNRNNKWEDYSLEVNTETESSDYPFVATLGGIDSSDGTIIMFDDRMTAIKYQMLGGLTNDTAVTQNLRYWDGSGWVMASNLVDLTLDAGSTDTLNKTGVVSWTPPDEALEFPREMFGVYGYAYKIMFSGILEDGAEHDGTSVDVVTGIPAQIKIRPFKFPAKYNNRTMLCGFTQSNQGNRVDYSLPNAPDVYNGEETSNGGVFSLYFGGEQELSAGTELYNRFGSNIFSTFVALKDTETYLLTGNTPDMEDPEHFRIFPISYNIGCPAPLTLATAELGYEVAQDAQRNVAIWLSYSGPILFDGAVIVPLKGIENYFDPSKVECINFDYINVSRGAYDQTKKEYNLLIPSGSAQTTNNTWLVYDLVRKKWFQKDPRISSEDSSSTNHGMLVVGGPDIVLTEVKFGVGSMYFDGGDDVFYATDHADWDVQATWTLDMWIRHGDHMGTETSVCNAEDAANEWYLQHIDGTGLRFGMKGDGITDWTMTGTEIIDTLWQHVLVVKVGNDWGIYQNGVQTAYKDTPDTDTYAGNMIMGTDFGSSNDFHGNLDDVRIYWGNPFSAAPVVGLTNTITAPTKPHVSDSSTKLLLHMDAGGEISFPQSLFTVTDVNGARYIYGGLDTGYMMYIEDGNFWEGVTYDYPIGQVVETGDFFPADKSPWYKTRFRRLKLVAEDITEDTDVYITHYGDTAYSGTSLDVLALDGGSNRLTRGTQNMNNLAWSHRLKFAAETSTTAKGMRLPGWGCQYTIEREDF